MFGAKLSKHEFCVKPVNCSTAECEPDLFTTPSSLCVSHTSLRVCICVDLGVCGKFTSKRVSVWVRKGGGHSVTPRGDGRRRLSAFPWSAQLLVSRVEARSRAQEETLMFPFFPLSRVVEQFNSFKVRD